MALTLAAGATGAGRDGMDDPGRDGTMGCCISPGRLGTGGADRIRAGEGGRLWRNGGGNTYT